MPLHPNAVVGSSAESLSILEDPLYADVVALRKERDRAVSLREQGEIAVLIEEEFRRIAVVLRARTVPTTV